jgi:hypothetical protein
MSPSFLPNPSQIRASRSRYPKAILLSTLRPDCKVTRAGARRKHLSYRPEGPRLLGARDYDRMAYMKMKVHISSLGFLPTSAGAS